MVSKKKYLNRNSQIASLPKKVIPLGNQYFFSLYREQ